MKRLITLLLAMVMALSFVVPAWANPVKLETNGASTGEQDVIIKVNATKTYSVTVEWESLTFIYERGAWSTNDHTYALGGWKVGEGTADTASAKVTVTNHSNAPVWYKATLGDGNGSVPGVSVELTGDTTGNLIAHPVGPNPGNAEKTFNVTVTDAPTDHNFSDTIVKKLVVTISTTGAFS